MWVSIYTLAPGLHKHHGGAGCEDSSKAQAWKPHTQVFLSALPLVALLVWVSDFASWNFRFLICRMRQLIFSFQVKGAKQQRT